MTIVPRSLLEHAENLERDAAVLAHDLRALASRGATPISEGGVVAERMALQLNDLINWMLGERGEFPSPPEELTEVIGLGVKWARTQQREIPVTKRPLYWWRKELRRRRDEIVNAPEARTKFVDNTEADPKRGAAVQPNGNAETKTAPPEVG